MPPTTHRQGNENVVISSMCRLEGDVDAVVGHILGIMRDLPFAYCVGSWAMLL